MGTNSRSFALTCGTDFYGGDFDNMNADSLEICTQACADNARCVAASFVGGKGAGHCYLKDGNNGAGVNNNVDGESTNALLQSSALTNNSDCYCYSSCVFPSCNCIDYCYDIECRPVDLVRRQLFLNHHSFNLFG
jgi:hypothetical protein